DYEVALIGATSEKVDVTIRDGTFGWARETGEAFGAAARRAVEAGEGLGRALGRAAEALPNARQSVLAACARAGIPCAVHVALGTDTIHMHPWVPPAELGAASHLDFRIMAAVACDLDGGVWANIGSAVILPEVFL